MDLSIIIPIYNTESEVLERCFASILGIDKLQYECLLIDDGSNEETARFCQQYAQKSDAFRYHRKANGGVGSARNMGIQLARGAYICFVDSDDKIEPSAYNKDLLDRNVDLIFTDLVFIDEKTRQRIAAFNMEEEVSYETAIERICQNGSLNGPYCKCIRRDFVVQSGVCFDEKMIIAEDAMFLMQLLQNKPKMMYINVATYYYYHSFQNGDNRLVKHIEECVNDLKNAYDCALACLEAGCFSEDERKALLKKRRTLFVSDLFLTAMVGVEKNAIGPNLKAEIRKIIKDTTAEEICRLDLSTRIKCALLRDHWLLLKWAALIRRIRKNLQN